jgi:hypothetical protein
MTPSVCKVEAAGISGADAGYATRGLTVAATAIAFS